MFLKYREKKVDVRKTIEAIAEQRRYSKHLTDKILFKFFKEKK
jgi:hypothetical protein